MKYSLFYKFISHYRKHSGLTIHQDANNLWFIMSKKENCLKQFIHCKLNSWNLSKDLQNWKKIRKNFIFLYRRKVMSLFICFSISFAYAWKYVHENFGKYTWVYFLSLFHLTIQLSSYVPLFVYFIISVALLIIHKRIQCFVFVKIGYF